MKFKIKSTLIPSSWFEKKITDTLKLYDSGKSLENSPLIEFMRNHKTTGGMHLDCVNSDDYEKSIQERQKSVIKLYEDIKKNGYVDDKPILVTFDDDGYMSLYDGHHRISILKYLNMTVELTVSTEWQGVDGKVGTDFPLLDVIKKTHKGREYLYQWVPDSRVQHLPCSRPKQHGEDRLEYLLKHIKGKTVLDIGCSEGYFSTELAKRGYTVIGVDIDRNLIATARYLSAIQGVKVDYYTGKWQDIVKNSDYFDTVLYFAVLHNQINADGYKKAMDDLELFRGKVGQMFIEIPNIKDQPDWAFAFKPDKFDRPLEFKTKLNIQDRWENYRPILLLNSGKKKDDYQKYCVKDIGEMYLPNNDYVTNFVAENGVWEPRTTQFIKDHLKEGQTFVDVGSQAGYFTLLASKIVGDSGKVISFEPSESNFEVLKENIKQYSNIKLVKKALSNREGKTELFIRNTPGQTSITKTSDKHYEVETARYSDQYEVPDMIKVDVEGAEMLVLEGMKPVLETDKPLYMIIEDWENKISKWLIENYNFKLVTTDRASGNKILAKNIKVREIKEPIRFHLLGPFNTPTTMADEGIGNAFGTKVVKLAKILKDLGHYVIFYGVEGSDVVCDEYVQVSTKEVLEKTYGKWNPEKVYGIAYGDLAHNTFNENAIREINKRKMNGDFLMCCLGRFQKPIADKVNIPFTVEIGIGYPGSFAKYRIFESYYIMNYTYGKENIGDINFYNTVIPGYFDLSEFEYSAKKDDYFLYLGRIVKRKGIGIAKQVCEHIVAKLVVAGFSSRDNKKDIQAFEEVVNSPNVEYVGFAGVEKRKELMKNAKAVFMPTTYLEPFGYVAIEAMLSGTPVITTDGGAFNETILHGKVGYRCRTFEEFVWAAKNIDKIKSKDCREWAEDNYSMELAKHRYNEYFNQLLNLYGKGWYEENPERNSLDSLKIKV